MSLFRLVAERAVQQGMDSFFQDHHRSAQHVHQPSAYQLLIIAVLLQIGMKETMVLPVLHEDAPDLLNVTSSLRTVCQELRDRKKRYPRKVGYPIPARLTASQPDQIQDYCLPAMSLHPLIHWTACLPFIFETFSPG